MNLILDVEIKTVFWNVSHEYIITIKLTPKDTL